MSIELRYALPADAPRIRRFLADYWAPDNIYVREPRLFDWTFGGRGLWDGEGCSFALAEAGGEIVGILGAIPFALNHFGRRARALWLANYMIAPEHRRGPLAIRLLQAMRREPYEATVAFGINARTAPMYQVLRWRVLDNIPRQLLLLPEAVERTAALLARVHADWPGERRRALAKGFALADEPSSAESAIAGWPEDWDKCGWAPWARKTVGAARDDAYLRWRYREHPLFAYRAIALRENDRVGLLVWRLETIRADATDGPQPFDRIGRVVELLPCSPDNARALVARLVESLRAEDALGADFYAYHGEIRRWAAAAGFRPAESVADGDRFPARFQPLDAKSPAICSSLYVPAEFPACTLEADCPWYWTKSDADQDRPN